MATELEGLIPEDQQMSNEEMRLAGVGLSGPARWLKVGRMAEQRGYRLGWEARMESLRATIAEAQNRATPEVVIGPGLRLCEEHCWCAYTPEDYPDWAAIITGMQTTAHEHGDAAICTGCMLASGQAVIALTEPVGDVTCPTCRGTGKMWGYGDQCKRCYGATTVRRDTLTDVEREALVPPIGEGV